MAPWRRGRLDADGAATESRPSGDRCGARLVKRDSRFTAKENKMTKSISAAIASTLVLAACASGVGPQEMYSDSKPRIVGYSLSAMVAAPNPTAPNVFITASKEIVVDQEPVRPPGNREGDPITIYFALEEGGPWKFPHNGIEIRQHPNFCQPVTGSVFVIRCSYNRPTPGTVYKYTIRVDPVGPGSRLRDLDPSIMN
jgi:hypothetical protein